MENNSLTVVIDNEGEIKIAQFGLFDGDARNAGINILNFLKNKIFFNKLVSALSKIKFASDEFLDEYSKNLSINNDEFVDKRTEKQLIWHEKFENVNLGSKILLNIINSNENEIILVNKKYLAEKGGNSTTMMTYVINLKNNTFEIYHTIDSPMFKSYQLNKLPEESDFINGLPFHDFEYVNFRKLHNIKHENWC